ncbi:MAG: hypothetical protein HC822_03240 [Oscillochloris sp.]|nr:hypothetical protein [Oscillochloris sp.]
MRPSEPDRPPESIGEAQTLDWLSRLGAADQDEADEVASAVAAAVAPPPSITRRSADQVAATRLLSQLVRSPYPEPAPIAEPEPLTRWQRIGLDRVLYALLALVVLIGGIAPALAAPLGSIAPQSAAAVNLNEMIAGLDAESVVLIAYDWGAQRSTELRAIEQPVIQRLVEQRAKMIILSTDLQGTLLSFDLREPLRAAGYNVEPDGRVFGGRDYVLLGYLPGGEIALRSIARDLRSELANDFIGQDATTGLVANFADGRPRVSGITDLDMILVIADQTQDVQSWMEQVHFAANDVPMVFLLPEEVRPMVQPYLRLPGIYHLAGSNDALAFAAQSTNADPTAIAQASGRQTLTVLAFIMLLLIGMIASLAGRRRSPEEETRAR